MNLRTLYFTIHNSRTDIWFKWMHFESFIGRPLSIMLRAYLVFRIRKYDWIIISIQWLTTHYNQLNFLNKTTNIRYEFNLNIVLCIFRIGLRDNKCSIVSIIYLFDIRQNKIAPKQYSIHMHFHSVYCGLWILYVVRGLFSIESLNPWIRININEQ